MLPVSTGDHSLPLIQVRSSFQRNVNTLADAVNRDYKVCVGTWYTSIVELLQPGVSLVTTTKSNEGFEKMTAGLCQATDVLIC